MIAGGARLIQLREKHASPREFYEAAAEAVAVAGAGGARLIINDRVDIAMALGTGVHLGQDDLPPAQARELLGPDAIIGYSTHTIEQARAARSLPVDYIAIGPIFETGTKENPDAVVGTDLLPEVRNATVGMPLVAIGGINANNLLSVYDAGADSAAIIGDITGALDITERVQHLLSLAA